MYVCGPTVQSAPHVGHLRSALAYDLLRRWFTACGLHVTLVRNVTDIDDKILANANSKEPWWALAYRIEREFNDAYNKLGITPPTYEPRATANIDRIHQLIQQLMARGHAYQALDATANIYFDTESWPEYGELTGQNGEQLLEAASNNKTEQGKKDPRDFALWKASKTGEPESASWHSPWGPGRPGWHIECSAMATKYLGNTFDIHGGGLDLRFPHHENELAQSKAAGQPFAKHWLHNGLVNIGGQKMSKSLGNSLYAKEILEAANPLAVRYFLSSAHYRSVLDYTPESLTEAEQNIQRIKEYLRRTNETLGENTPAPNTQTTHCKATLNDLPDSFKNALHDDFNIPKALAALHTEITAGNNELDKLANTTTPAQTQKAQTHAHKITAMLDVLGLDPRNPNWQNHTTKENHTLNKLVEEIITQRENARENKNWELADQLRNILNNSGIQLKDTKNTSSWSIQ